MGKRRKNWMKPVGRLMHGVFFVCGCLVVLLVLIFTLCIFGEGLTAFFRFGPLDFLLGTVWDPVGAVPQYGLLPLVLSTVYISVAAMLIAGPLGTLCALFATRLAPPAVRTLLQNLMQLMGGIPSVVYGLLGYVWLLPWIQRTFAVAHGEGLLATVIVLSGMFVPRVATMVTMNLSEVPRDVEMAARALGAQDAEIWYKVSLRHVRGDIIITLLMQSGIVAGETLAVMMVAGNVANMPGLFTSVQTLTTAIGSEAFSTGSEQWHTLFSIALVLFCMVMILFGVIRFINKYKRGGKG